MQYSKKFLILETRGAIAYKDVFPLFRDNKVWLGCTTPKEFFTTLNEVENPKTQYKREDGKVMQKFGNICWYTNLNHNKRGHKMYFHKMWPRDASEYIRYANYDALEVPKVCDIPEGYNGVLGVPITFLDKYCPNQFEIIGCTGDQVWCKEVGIEELGEKVIEMLKAQGNNGHFVPCMRNLYYMDKGVVVMPYSRIFIRFREGGKMKQ